MKIPTLTSEQAKKAISSVNRTLEQSITRTAKELGLSTDVLTQYIESPQQGEINSAIWDIAVAKGIDLTPEQMAVMDENDAERKALYDQLNALQDEIQLDEDGNEYPDNPDAWARRCSEYVPRLP